MSKQLIYSFDTPPLVSNSDTLLLLGGKGAALSDMRKLGFNVPPGFTISTELCDLYHNNDYIIPDSFLAELSRAIKELEANTGKQFGGEIPLLLSVRSGAAISMPGMMDTILNLGMNDFVAERLSSITNNREFVFDNYRRLIHMYGNTVCDIPSYVFDSITNAHNGSMEELAQIMKQVFLDYTGKPFPDNCREQLLGAINAVLRSWNSQRAISYRQIHGIDNTIGTAVNIQAMVFGNFDNYSATGVVFTRSPVDGSARLYGEYLPCAQGEDIVAGTHTPLAIYGEEENAMSNSMPALFTELHMLCQKLEKHYQDMQDIEFTIESGKLYILQTRSGKRTAKAAIKIATDLVADNILSKEDALLSIDPISINQLLHAQIDYSQEYTALTSALPASPGAATGVIALSSAKAEELSRHHKVILIRHDTSPEDIRGMASAEGILTARGGMTSHAAVVARGMGKPCICGASELLINEKNKTVSIGKITLNEGDVITIDGSKGLVINGEVAVILPELPAEFQTFIGWADEYRSLGVKANAETVTDIKAALKFGAEGIGLCRTEHMFFEKEKISLIHRIIVSDQAEDKQYAIDELKPLHQADFVQIFELLKGKPVNIRLLDPPLHEFLPKLPHEIAELASLLRMSIPQVEYRITQLEEANPMLGHRGCRLGITHPEIYLMQIDAILDAAAYVILNGGQVKLEIMLPLITSARELEILANMVRTQQKLAEAKYGIKFHLLIGTMIETPRACIIADKLAGLVDYFSFGTNDLTQTTFGLSRDDAASFLGEYIKQSIYDSNPFTSIDTKGVGELMKLCTKVKEKNPNFIIGVCGEHGGDPESIKFFDQLGLDYVSCSPYRILVARLAGAISSITRKNQSL